MFSVHYGLLIILTVVVEDENRLDHDDDVLDRDSRLALSPKVPQNDPVLCYSRSSQVR